MHARSHARRAQSGWEPQLAKLGRAIVIHDHDLIVMSWVSTPYTALVGCLISDFNFTSKTLLVKVILLVKLDQHSKKDLE